MRYELRVVRVGEDGHEQIVAIFPTEMPSTTEPKPEPSPRPTPIPMPEPVPGFPPAVEATVNVRRLFMREAPTLNGTKLATLLTFGQRIMVQGVHIDADGHRWRNIAEGKYVGAWVSQGRLGSDGTVRDPYLILDTPPPATEPEPEPDQPPKPKPAQLTGSNIELVTLAHPMDGPYTGLKIEHYPWSAFPKLMVNWRSGVISQVRGLTMFDAGGVDLALSADEFREQMDQFNNTDNTGERYSINAAYVRVFVPQEQMLAEGREDELIDNLLRFLDECYNRNMKAMLVWNDSLRTEVTHTYPGETQYHTLGDGHLNADYWEKRAYMQEMVPFMEKALPKVREHLGLGMHQLWNEPHPVVNGSKYQARLFKDAVREVSQVICEIDQAHPISIGLIHSGVLTWEGANARDAAEYLYGPVDGYLEHIHLHSCHMYARLEAQAEADLWQGEQIVEMELYDIARKYGRVPMIDECMVWNKPANVMLDPTKQLDAMLERHYTRGLYAAGIWGAWFGNRDARQGGRERAWDSQFNSAFYDIRELLQKWGHLRLATIQS